MNWVTASAIGISALALTCAYAQQPLWTGVVCIVGVAVFWLLALQRAWHGAAHFALIGLIVFAAFGAWSQLTPILLVIGVVAALAAWDLSYFDAQLQDYTQIIGADTLIRIHLRRLLLICGIGTMIAALALGLSITMSFGWILLVAIVAIFSLTRLIGSIHE